LFGEEDAAGEEFVFMGAAGVREDQGKRKHVCEERRCGGGVRNGRGVDFGAGLGG
jgi:hypothetical protein